MGTGWGDPANSRPACQADSGLVRTELWQRVKVAAEGAPSWFPGLGAGGAQRALTVPASGPAVCLNSLPRCQEAKPCGAVGEFGTMRRGIELRICPCPSSLPIIPLTGLLRRGQPRVRPPAAPVAGPHRRWQLCSFNARERWTLANR